MQHIHLINEHHFSQDEAVTGEPLSDGVFYQTVFLTIVVFNLYVNISSVKFSI